MGFIIFDLSVFFFARKVYPSKNEDGDDDDGLNIATMASPKGQRSPGKVFPLLEPDKDSLPRKPSSPSKSNSPPKQAVTSQVTPTRTFAPPVFEGVASLPKLELSKPILPPPSLEDPKTPLKHNSVQISNSTTSTTSPPRTFAPPLFEGVATLPTLHVVSSKDQEIPAPQNDVEIEEEEVSSVLSTPERPSTKRNHVAPAVDIDDDDDGMPRVRTAFAESGLDLNESFQRAKRIAVASYRREEDEDDLANMAARAARQHMVPAPSRSRNAVHASADISEPLLKPRTAFGMHMQAEGVAAARRIVVRSKDEPTPLATPPRPVAENIDGRDLMDVQLQPVYTNKVHQNSVRPMTGEEAEATHHVKIAFGEPFQPNLGPIRGSSTSSTSPAPRSARTALPSERQAWAPSDIAFEALAPPPPPEDIDMSYIKWAPDDGSSVNPYVAVLRQLARGVKSTGPLMACTHVMLEADSNTPTGEEEEEEPRPRPQRSSIFAPLVHSDPGADLRSLQQLVQVLATPIHDTSSLDDVVRVLHVLLALSRDPVQRSMVGQHVSLFTVMIRSVSARVGIVLHDEDWYVDD